MNLGALKHLRNYQALVIAGLSILAVLGFTLVNRLVNRFAEQEKALARHLYEQGLSAQRSGQLDRAIERFRGALTYSHDNFQYQLSLARVLRDTGRTSEAQTYLVNLWEHAPQDAAVNLALGRLAARQRSLDAAIQYYHNAIYGVWASDADTNRFNAWFELIDFLLQQGAGPQAEAELITLSAALPPDSRLRLGVANLYVRAQDYEHALDEYQSVLKIEHHNSSALAGAGLAAFKLGRYRTAKGYLERAVNAAPSDAQSAQLLQISNLVLEADPFTRGVSSAERNRRISTAFARVGERLDDCARARGIDINAPSSSALSSLNAQWLATKLQLKHLNSDSAVGDAAMDLVFQIEQETQKECGSPQGLDQALLLLAENRTGVDQ
jgi:tetratricopeptide (TPR) repeat protein